MKQVTIFTDGACKGNPGPGGYAAILKYGEIEKEVVGSSRQTTNNRMELMAAIVGLEALKQKCHVTIVTDSSYLTTILNGGKAKTNHDLVTYLRELAKRHERVTTQKIPGHSGHVYNTRCDRLAKQQANERAIQEKC